VTALATSVRARPWNLPSDGSSVAGLACSTPSFSSKLMPGGNACRILPFGPWTSTAFAASITLTVTPLGIGIGFLPIRDMCVSPSPDVAKHLAADAGLDRFAAGHHAARRGQDRGSQPRQHLGHIVPAEVDAAAGTADALD